MMYYNSYYSLDLCLCQSGYPFTCCLQHPSTCPGLIRIWSPSNDQAAETTTANATADAATTSQGAGQNTPDVTVSGAQTTAGPATTGQSTGQATPGASVSDAPTTDQAAETTVSAATTNHGSDQPGDQVQEAGVQRAEGSQVAGDTVVASTQRPPSDPFSETAEVLLRARVVLDGGESPSPSFPGSDTSDEDEDDESEDSEEMEEDDVELEDPRMRAPSYRRGMMAQMNALQRRRFFAQPTPQCRRPREDVSTLS